MQQDSAGVSDVSSQWRRAARAALSLLALVLASQSAAEPVAGDGGPVQWLTDDGTMLTYNVPAAVRTENGYAIGWTDSKGLLTIAELDTRFTVTATTELHQYDKPDDHSPPALFVIPSGPLKGRILAATSHHRSRMFVYLSRSATVEDGFEQVGVLSERNTT